MNIRDMDAATLLHLATELDRSAAFWKRVGLSSPDQGYQFHADHLKALAARYRKRARLAQGAQP
jgi:hypothetical protein